MGLFPSAKDFEEGPGVDKNTPRKTGILRFFEVVGRDLTGMFLANFLACLGFVPGICIVLFGFASGSLVVMAAGAVIGGAIAGPCLAGVYDTVLRALRDEPGYWWSTYRRAFRQNWKSSILPGIFYGLIITLQVSLVYFCVTMPARGVQVGTGIWVGAILNLVVFHMLFTYMWPQVVLLNQPFHQTLVNSLLCMLGFLPHALAASLLQIVFWGIVILTMPLGVVLMVLLGFWFTTEICCQMITGDLERVFHVEAQIRAKKDAELAEYLAQEDQDSRGE